MLLQFRNSAAPAAACRHILEHSPSAEARFHAACTLREAALREWAAHSPEQLSGIRSYALQYAARHAGEPRLAVVRKVLAGAAAVMLKRGWGGMAHHERAAFFQVWGRGRGGPTGPWFDQLFDSLRG